MAAFRLFSKLTTFYGDSGELLAGGSLKFYEAGTTTPANVYGEKALTTNNGSTIALDASGRPADDIWADTTSSFFVELYDADSVKQGEMDNVEVPGGTAQVVPVPAANFFLTGDSTNYLTEDLSDRLVPDVTGQADKVLSTDGAVLTWVAKPADGAAGVSDTSTTSTSIVVGDKMIQFGNDSAPAAGSGGKSTTKAVTFGTAFAATPKIVKITPTDGTVTPSGCLVRYAVTSKSTTGFTVKFSTLTGGTSADNTSGSDITSAVAFDWEATGAKA